MDLIDEQELPRLQIHQQANDVAGAFQCRSAGDPAADPKLLRQHQRHGGLAEARRAVQQNVIQGFAAAQGRLHCNAQHLLQLGLADVITQASRPQPVIGFGCSLLRQRLGIEHGLAARCPPAGIGGDDRHAGRVPSSG